MSDGILADSSILQAVESGSIVIDPFRPDQVNPSSYDVTLGGVVCVYETVVRCYRQGPGRSEDGRFFEQGDLELDSRQPLTLKRFDIDPDVGWVIKPGIGYLMHTVERICTFDFVPILDGKSTIGRLFVSIHETAGFGDVGFDGQFTLEVTCTHPVRLYPGMRIGQIRFQTVSGKVLKTYDQTGKYRNEHAQGPVASQSYKMFEKK